MDNIKILLDKKITQYKQSSFISKDPISIPHQFTKPLDIEISGFFAATLAWGNRTSILNNAKRLITLMDDSPYEFIANHQETDLRKFKDFKHRTFNDNDLLYFIYFLKQHYKLYPSLEYAFVSENDYNNDNVEQALIHFKQYFFSLEHPIRTHKHISTPINNSACKRLNMYLRWMVRNDNVDFGIWKKIKTHQLICPVDIHVSRVAYKLRLIENEKANWKNALKLTLQLKTYNPDDPVSYDYALFSLGAEEDF